MGGGEATVAVLGTCDGYVRIALLEMANLKMISTIKIGLSEKGSWTSIKAVSISLNFQEIAWSLDIRLAGCLMQRRYMLPGP